MRKWRNQFIQLLRNFARELGKEMVTRDGYALFAFVRIGDSRADGNELLW